MSDCMFQKQKEFPLANDYELQNNLLYINKMVLLIRLASVSSNRDNGLALDSWKPLVVSCTKWADL